MTSQPLPSGFPYKWGAKAYNLSPLPQIFAAMGWSLCMKITSNNAKEWARHGSLQENVLNLASYSPREGTILLILLILPPPPQTMIIQKGTE